MFHFHWEYIINYTGSTWITLSEFRFPAKVSKLTTDVQSFLELLSFRLVISISVVFLFIALLDVWKDNTSVWMTDEHRKFPTKTSYLSLCIEAVKSKHYFLVATIVDFFSKNHFTDLKLWKHTKILVPLLPTCHLLYITYLRFGLLWKNGKVEERYATHLFVLSQKSYVRAFDDVTYCKK